MKEITIKISDRLYDTLSDKAVRRNLRVEEAASMVLAEIDDLSLSFTREELISPRPEPPPQQNLSEMFLQDRVLNLLLLKGVTDQEIATFRKILDILEEYFEET